MVYEVTDGFRSKYCDGITQEVNLAEDLVVDGEMFEYVELLLCMRH